YYYAPGWWEGGAQVSLYVNDAAYNELPKAYQTIIDLATRAAGSSMVAKYDSTNPDALRRLIASRAVLRRFPRDVTDADVKTSNQLFKEFTDKDPRFKKIYDSYMGFRDNNAPWHRVAEGAYDNYLGAALAAQRR